MNKLPNINDDFSAWYQEIVAQAELADHSPVRGSIVIRPYGYAIWEHIKERIDQRIKATGHQNASFPLLIPESYLKREAAHVEGFAPEVAVVTHAGGKQLEEPLVVRPTSETIIHAMFARWIHSWRDLPLKINQWANVVRWEMRPRAFIRTTEIFWQEGHTAHATYQEAHDETVMMLNEYVDLAHEWLAIPAIPGLKPAMEKFPGAEKTYTFEALMQDGKAVQMGTSHLLSQNFAKVANMVFQDEQGKQCHPYLTSWGVTTRLVGTVIMVHGDQKGLILPPKIAPFQVVIIPILKKEADNGHILQMVEKIKLDLERKSIRVITDTNVHQTPGAKFYHWELRGVPLRIELGPRDLQAEQIVVTDRITGIKENVSLNNAIDSIEKKLQEIQKSLYQRAVERRDASLFQVKRLAEFGDQLAQRGGFYQTGWCQGDSCEQELRRYHATIRCLTLVEPRHEECFFCGKKSPQDILIAKSY